MGWVTEADNVLAHVHLDQITNKRVRTLANAAFADYYIKAQQAEQAIPYLTQAVKGFKGSNKVRMSFLLGQLYEEVGDKHNAYLAYKQAGSSSGSATCTSPTTTLFMPSRTTNSRPKRAPATAWTRPSAS